MSKATANAAIDVRNLTEFFRDSLRAALSKQHAGVEDHTEHYVVNMLTMFSRSEALFEATPQGPRLMPLALMLADAAQAETPSNARASCSASAMSRSSWQAFSPRVSSASSSTSITTSRWVAALTARWPKPVVRARAGRALGVVFAELARKFQRLVDALNEVSEMAHQHDHRDVLRQYEIWLKTGSPRAHGILRSLGVEPTVVSSGRVLS